jgi:hypothetical protein
MNAAERIDFHLHEIEERIDLAEPFQLRLRNENNDIVYECGYRVSEIMVQQLDYQIEEPSVGTHWLIFSAIAHKLNRRVLTARDRKQRQSHDESYTIGSEEEEDMEEGGGLDAD